MNVAALEHRLDQLLALSERLRRAHFANIGEGTPWVTRRIYRAWWRVGEAIRRLEAKIERAYEAAEACGCGLAS
jgi:2-oxo-4-hydroxy-4-carboxy--5-ureidoimidazoline (OHCU) decarboxylase